MWLPRGADFHGILDDCHFFYLDMSSALDPEQSFKNRIGFHLCPLPTVANVTVP